MERRRGRRRCAGGSKGRLGGYMWIHTLVRRMPSDDGCCCFLFGAFWKRPRTTNKSGKRLLAEHKQRATAKWNLLPTRDSTHMAILVELIVGQLQLVEGHYLLHPVGTGGRRIGMHMNTWRRYGIRFACHHPAGTAIPDKVYIRD